ncbi:MAG: glycosyltransferase family 39 protein [Verrucomicrobia bacterium]|nr:glycosyltransferase family 39 protein [Verrucomicrobiota bacterium]
MTAASFIPPVDESASWRRDLLWLALAFGLLFGFLLGSRPLANPDEGRYAEIPREMVAGGDWVTPRLNAVPYFEKPPLVYWSVALCLRAFGPNEWSARLAPALFGLGGVLLTYAAARRLHGRATALASAVVLGTGLLYFAMSRLLSLDMAVSVLMSATLFCFILGVREPAPAADAAGATGSPQADSANSPPAGSRSGGARRRWLFYGLYASAALATLAKGLIGFLLTGAVMFLWLLLFNQWKRLRPLYLPTGGLLFLAIAAPWHVLVAQRNAGWTEFYFVNQHWARFTTTEHGRYEPWWYFIPVVVLGLFPWTGFLWGALREAAAGGWARRKENADQWFLITWVAFMFLFFTKSQSKLIPYILPVFPPLAVMIGAWLARRWAENAAARLRAAMGIFAFACGVIAIAALVAAQKPGTFGDPGRMDAFRPFLLAIAVILLLGGVAAPWAARVRGVRAGLATLVATTVGLFIVIVLAAPDVRGTKPLALIVRARMQPADRVYHYHAFFHDFVYYTQRPVGLVNYQDELELQFLDPTERAARFIDAAELRRQWSGPQRVWLVARKHEVKALLGDPGFRYHLPGETRTHYLFSNQP